MASILEQVSQMARKRVADAIGGLGDAIQQPFRDKYVTIKNPTGANIRQWQPSIQTQAYQALAPLQKPAELLSTPVSKMYGTLGRRAMDIGSFLHPAIYNTQTAKNFKRNVFGEDQGAGQDLLNMFGGASNIAGATKPLVVGAYTGLGTAIRSGSDLIQGRMPNLSANFQASVKDAIPMAGANALLPLDKLGNTVSASSKVVGKLGPTVAKNLKLPLNVVGNVAQGIGMDASAGNPFSPEGVVIDALFPIAGEYLPKALRGTKVATQEASEIKKYYAGEPRVNSKILEKVTVADIKEKELIDQYDRITFRMKANEEQGIKWGRRAYERALNDIKKQLSELRKSNTQSGKINFGEIADAVGGNKTPRLNDLYNKQNIPNFVNPKVKTTEIPFVEKNKQGPIKQWLNSVLDPIKNAPKQVRDSVQNWRNSNLVARQKANEVVGQFSGIPEKDGFKIIKYIQNPTLENAQSMGLDTAKYATQIKQIGDYYEAIRKEGLDRGLDIGYLDNYINQVWKESPQEIQKKITQALRKNPQFTLERQIPSYREGLELGLTPKFTHPAQLASHYRLQMEKAFANKQLIDDLMSKNMILPAEKAPREWKLIDTPLIPNIDAMRAEPDVAKALNNMFTFDPESKVLKAGANVSRYMQDVTLSGGVPKTPLNAFTLGNVIKEITAGRVRSPLSAVFNSLTDGQTTKYFDKNSNYMKMAAQEGLNIRANTNYEDAYKNIFENKSFKEQVGDTWNNLINKPTFERFMPQLTLNMFKDTYDSAIKNGMDEVSARKLAGETTKAWTGAVDSFSRSKNVDNTLTSLFFAPKFRETMFNFWGNNAKSLTTQIKNPAFKYNRRFLAGMVGTYVLMNIANKQLTGNFMFENKEGKEFSLEIPQADGRSWFIPMLPSVGTLPRRALEMTGALAKGDVATATQKAGSFLSQPISLGSQLLSNRTFYGGPIYDSEDTALQKVGKLAGYGFEQSSHPFIGEPMAVAQGRKTPTEALLGALELPVYPSKSTEANNLRGNDYEYYKQLQKEGGDTKAFAQTIKLRQQNDKLINTAKEEVRKTQTGKMAGNNYVFYDPEKEQVRTISLDFNVEKPKLSGNNLIDKKLFSQYKSALTSKQNDVVKLYELGVISEEQAISELTRLQGLYTTASNASKKPKAGKIKVPSTKAVLSKRSTSKPNIFRTATAKRRKISDYLGNYTAQALPQSQLKVAQKLVSKMPLKVDPRILQNAKA